MSPSRRPPPCRMFQDRILILTCYSREARSRSRKHHGCRRPAANRARNRQLSRHAPRQVAGDRQSKPDAGVPSRRSTLGLKEGLENALDLLLRNSDARVAYPDANACALTLRTERDHAAVVRVLRCVREEADQNLLKALRVSVHGKLWRDIALQNDVLAVHLRLDERLDGIEDVGNLNVLPLHRHLALLGPHEAEDLLDDGKKLLFVAMNMFDGVGLLLVERTINSSGEQVGVAGDRVERRAELVTHHREKLRLREIRLRRVLARLTSLGIGRGTFGDRCTQEQEGGRDECHERLKEEEAVTQLRSGERSKAERGPGDGDRGNNEGDGRRAAWSEA